MSIIAQKLARIHSRKLRYSSQKLFLIQLGWYADENGEFFWSMERLAQEWGMNIKTVYNRFKIYVEKGILEITDKLVGKYNRIKTYRFVNPLALKKEDKKETVQSLILPGWGGLNDIYQYIEKKENVCSSASSEICDLPKTAPNNFPDFPGREQEMTATENPYEIPPPIQDHDVIKLNKSAFDEKFGKKQVTIEQLYDDYNKHFQGRVSVAGFRKWIEKEFVSNYKDKPISRFAQPKTFAREELPTQEEWDQRKTVAAPHLQALKNLLGIFRR